VDIKGYREDRGLGLREVARKAKISPTYLSQIERGEQRWPTEDVLLRLANAVAHEPTALLHKAGRVSAEILEIFKRHPDPYTNFLCATRELNDEELEAVVKYALLYVRKIIEKDGKKRGSDDDRTKNDWPKTSKRTRNWDDSDY